MPHGGGSSVPSNSGNAWSSFWSDFGSSWNDFWSNVGGMFDGSNAAKQQGEQNLELQKQAQGYNSAEAAKQREWEEHMASTQYQRAVEDLRKAGLNPWLAVSGINGGSPSGASASSSASSVNMKKSGSEVLANLTQSAVSAAIIAKIVAKLVK